MSIPEAYQDGCAKLELMLSRSEVRQRVVHLLVHGKSRKAISHALQRSPHTIVAHIKALYRGVGVNDRAQLIVVAVLLFRFGGYCPPLPPELGTGKHQ